MKAAYYDRQGPAHDVIQLGDLPDPEPGPGEVRVRVHVSGLNPSDTKTRGAFGGRPMGFPRIVPHQDGAGVIDRVGPGVPEARLGERVWVYEAQFGRAFGTAAQFTVVPAAKAVVLPSNVSFETGACLGVPALTAHRCLLADGDLRGRWVLVQGGAGAVGTAAILLAKWAGAFVATTVSRSEQEKVAREAGADLVINRQTEDVAVRVKEATLGKGVDRIVEVNLKANLAIDMACLALDGTVSAYATDDPAAVIPIPFVPAMQRGFNFRFMLVYTMSEEAHRQAVREVTACLEAGAYRPVIGLRLPLERVIEAHEAQDSGRMIGKIILDTGV
ncbi:NADPH:quinone reductase [Nordella sp. HKS 07]|uniref:NADPH:quinone reductase n=1 Tax=Nordella sp. HKS 07 TaxID=2712222 RepID=UPI0013E1A2C3|nr:NADPH:quinone reductase [Nordella sp. HKS 07]QIG47799.1 NADPH:quinone reductase [Nordella sp. HKS 07]